MKFNEWETFIKELRDWYMSKYRWIDNDLIIHDDKDEEKTEIDFINLIDILWYRYNNFVKMLCMFYILTRYWIWNITSDHVYYIKKIFIELSRLWLNLWRNFYNIYWLYRLV